MWAFWDPISFVFTLSYFFKSETSNLLLGTPGHCPVHHYVCCWCDFPPCLIWVDHCSFLYYLLHHHFPFCSWFVILISPLAFFFPYHTLLLPVWHSTYIVLTYPAIRSFFFITSLSMSHSCWAHSSPWLTSFSIHVAFHIWGHGFLIIGYLSLVSFHFYYPITLAYVTSRVLRPPWGHGIRCRLWQPLLGQVFEIWLMFGYRHASSSGSCLFDV